jgi:HAD superfamily hydrolase (TIGR01509 family)
MDETLVELNLPFDEIRRSLDIHGRYILESIMQLDEDEREKKFEILKQFEIEAAKRTRLMPYAKDVLEKIDSLGLKKGIVTRNCRESVDIIANRFGLDFDFIITREDAEPKPSPAPILLALKQAKSKPEKSITIGDFKFDLIAGKSAGTKTALVLTERNRTMARDFVHLADFVLNSLIELKRFLY